MSGQWKCTFLKGVWNRLHKNVGGTAAADSETVEADASTISGDPLKDLSGKEMQAEFPEEGDAAVAEIATTAEEEIEATDTLGTADNSSLSYGHNNFEGSEEQENLNDLKGMKDMIKAAALWLTERDAEYEARCGRVRRIKRR